jgi:hypothetical protein
MLMDCGMQSRSQRQMQRKQPMKTKLAITCLICGMLLGSAVALAQDSDADRSHPKAFVKDSVITTKNQSQAGR